MTKGYTFLTLLLLACIAGYSQPNTALVKYYNGIPVFYRCKPSNPYKIIGYESRNTVVNNVTDAFETYTRIARRDFKDCMGIIMAKDLNMDMDSFDVIRFTEVAANNTAVLPEPIFFSATPVMPYQVDTTILCRAAWIDLGRNLQNFYEEARQLRRPFDGIIVDDVNYSFAKNKVQVFRWKKGE